MNRRNQILGLYFSDDDDLRQEYRNLMLEKYLEEADHDFDEALALLRFRLELATKQEAYEECAIIIDILEEFE